MAIAPEPVKPTRFTRFTRFAAIDWSGARGSRHPGIAIAVCDAGSDSPALVEPPDRHWSRAGVLDWLLAHRTEAMLVGFDFSFAAPFLDRGAYLPGETDCDQARALWPFVDGACADADLGAASFVAARRGRYFYCGAADGPKAGFTRLRACEALLAGRSGGRPSSVFDAIGAAQVAKASFAGMRLLHHLAGRMPVWPFDPVPAHGAVIVEIYTAIAARAAGLAPGRSKLRDAAALDHALTLLGSAPHRPLRRYDDHATDALLTAAWLRSHAGRVDLWAPPAMTGMIARSEGWTFGVA